MKDFDITNVFSTIIAFLALIMTCLQLRLSYRPNIVVRVHNYRDRTLLEIVNIGSIGAEDINVKFKTDDVEAIQKKVVSQTIKTQVGYLKELHTHKLQLLPGEVKPYILYMQNDRGRFADGQVLLRGVVSYKVFGFFRRVKRFKIDVSGTGSLLDEEWSVVRKRI